MKFISYVLIFFVLINCSSTPTYKKSDHYSPEKKIFFNPTLSEGEHEGLWGVLKWKLSFDAAKWPEWVELEHKPEIKTPNKGNELNITFVNHSTFILQMKNYTVLTDPIWSERTSPVQWVGPKRVHAPGVDFENLPKIDIVIISHNHYDHLDQTTLKNLEEKFSPVFIVPLGDKELMTSFGLKKVFELDWWQSLAFNELEIHFTPGQHFSGRGLTDRFESLWGGYVIKHYDQKIYFGGDTGYSTHFTDIYKKFGAMDLSLIPIGAYAPRWFMKAMHMNPDDAVQAHSDLKSKQSLGIHYGTFQLTDEKRDEPREKLIQALQERSIPTEKFQAMYPGQSKVFKLDKELD